ncbi:2-methylcitrate dehydratase [Caballeronia telluris]|jgi:2-methylcitrate dehydratase PrpD|uniref:2-methylcitrate dehydratase n=1 Tax=Caballeronia telluris TaxID=326475 RepID=A0A158ENC3_9BURK|nr:2-methylcitrate dehydratase [Caballeronia telluris]
MMTDHPSRTLATFAASIHFDDIPQHVVERTVNLYVDWLGSTLGGKGARPSRLGPNAFCGRWTQAAVRWWL